MVYSSILGLKESSSDTLISYTDIIYDYVKVKNLVDKEIKPIIRKWINKNLRKFVKNIVIEEMKSISKATQKPSSR